MKTFTSERAAAEALRRRIGIDAKDPVWPAYAWPGGYPLLYITDDGETLCVKCMNSEESVHFTGGADGWRIDGVDIDEGTGELVVCAHCGAVIVAEAV